MGRCGHLQSLGHRGGQGDSAEGRVNRAGPDSGDCRAGVEEGHDIEFGLGMRAVEVEVLVRHLGAYCQAARAKPRAGSPARSPHG
jgi:hypothetical protein